MPREAGCPVKIRGKPVEQIVARKGWTCRHCDFESKDKYYDYDHDCVGVRLERTVHDIDCRCGCTSALQELVDKLVVELRKLGAK